MTQPASKRLLTEARLGAVNGAAAVGSDGKVSTPLPSAITSARSLPALLNPDVTTPATPPTVTVGVGNAGSTIASSVHITAAALGCRMLSADYTNGTAGGWSGSLTSITLTTPTPAWMTRFEMETDSSLFEVGVNTNSSAAKYRLWVDGQAVTLDGNTFSTGGPSYWIKVDFGGVRKVRRILWESSYTAFMGLWAAPVDSFWPPAARNRPRVSVLGDSYAEGATDWGMNAWHMVAGRLLDWNVFPAGVGSTGILNPGGTGKVKYRDRVQADVIARNPDVVIIQGSSNDESFTAGLQAETTALIGAIKAGLPNAQIIVTGPFKPFSITAAGNPTAVRDAVQAAAAAAGLPFIDPIGYPSAPGWITGTGKSGTPKNDGNADLYVNTDGTHYTKAGYEYAGRRFVTALRELHVGY